MGGDGDPCPLAAGHGPSGTRVQDLPLAGLATIAAAHQCVAARFPSTRCRPARAGRLIRIGPAGPAPRVDGGLPRAARSDPRPWPGAPWAGGRTDRGDEAAAPPRPAASLSRHHRTAGQGEGPLATRGATASRHAEAHASVASPRVARPSHHRGDPDEVTRTCLRGEKEDMSKWG